jgi:glutathione S-transferase
MPKGNWSMVEQTIELYHHPASTCSQRVRLALHHKRLPFTAHSIDLSAGEHLTDSYLALNPNGVVPTLVAQGVAVWDSSAILEYLEDVHPDMPLRPHAAFLCARMRSWCRYIDEVPTAAVRVPSFNQHFAKNWTNFTSEERQRHADRLPVRKHFFLKMGSEGFSDEELNASLEQLGKCLLRMEAALTQTAWLAGDNYSLADVSLTPTIVRLDDLGRQHMWDNMPAVIDWYERIRSLDNFAPTFAPPARLLHLLTPDH